MAIAQIEQDRLDEAIRLNDEHPEFCWVDLCLWALDPEGYDHPLENPEEYSYQSCTDDNWYCGKCVVTGRLHPPEVERVENGKIIFKDEAAE